MSEPTVADLMKKIELLEAGMETTRAKLDEEIKHNANMDRLNTELRKLIEKDVIDAFERIKNIELRLFPNLACDISEINKIIGEGENRAWNPLDHRKS